MTNRPPLVLAIFLFLQFLAVRASLNACQVNVPTQVSEPRVEWFFDVDASGSANVTVFVNAINQSELQFDLPKTHKTLKINPDMNYIITPINASSYDQLIICNISTTTLGFTFTWPDGAMQYENVFYFSGQEKFEVGLSNVTVWLPEKASVSWVEDSNLTGDHETLYFECSEWDTLPSFSYSFVHQSRIDLALEASEHVNLHYHPVMKGKPWINRTIKVIEHSWSWLRTTLNGTIDHVNVTFAPYGYNDLGVKYGGFCYYNSRNIEIVATEQFGIGLIGWNTAAILHELSHAFTPLLEDLPSFFCEAIAEDCSYDALRRTSLNETADSLEEGRFDDAYWDGVQQSLLDYIWLWKWNDTIYDNSTITSACYGVSAFIGDYIVHHWGYAAFVRLTTFYNKTEIDGLPENRRLIKFIKYLNMACNYNMSEIFSDLALLITQWDDANNMRSQNYTIEMIGPFTWYINPRLKNLVKDANNEYNSRNYDLANSNFHEARALVNSGFWQSLDYLFWIVVVLVALGCVISVRRRR